MGSKPIRMHNIGLHILGIPSHKTSETNSSGNRQNRPCKKCGDVPVSSNSVKAYIAENHGRAGRTKEFSRLTNAEHLNGHLVTSNDHAFDQ